MVKSFGFTAALLVLASLPTSEAFARKPRVLGCSSADLNSYGGSSCVQRGQNDILSGSSSVHVAVCSGGKVYCCVQSGSSARNCVDVTDRRNSGGGVFTPSAGGARNGGTKSPTDGGGCAGGVC